MVSVRICVTIDKHQMDFCKQNGYKPSRILRVGIQKLLERGSDINFQKANILLQSRIDKMLEQEEDELNKRIALQEKIRELESKQNGQ